MDGKNKINTYVYEKYKPHSFHCIQSLRNINLRNELTTRFYRVHKHNLSPENYKLYIFVFCFFSPKFC